MPAPFKQITREQFAQLLSTFPFKRKINAVHMHHTWRPNHAQYRGHDTIVGMWRFHTETNGWSDIAQHITIAPDGSIWLGRDWNRAPASAAGHNGNAQAGPFMFEMIGDFDEGRDLFGGPQRETVVDVIARVQQRFGLPPGTLQFHNMMSTKSCPGTSIDFQDVLQDVSQRHQELMSSARAVPRGDGPFPADQVELHRVVKEAIASLQEGAGLAPDPFDAEPCAHGPSYAEAAGRANARGGIPASSRGNKFSAFELDAMRPHIVNLRKGQFSSSGDWTTSEGDVDAIFDQHLPAALKAARDRERPLRLMFYAHGGLNDEASALAGAHARIDWWQSNDIYPIYFIWETGLGETLGQMLEGWRQRRGAGRNVFSDHVSDPLIEAFAHRTLGVNLWDTMKTSAERASASNGGALYVAEKLAAFIDQHKGEVEVHAAGHSAGAIFHTHFVPCALARGVPRFDSLHLLAPAVRADLFRNNLFTHIGAGQGVENLTVYTMADSFEKDDNCALVYRKSLLYLIYKGLEFEVDTPILGLERCLRSDADLKRLFGLAGAKPVADVVWSDNQQERGRSASRARTHGGFDDDSATMGSIVRRVLGKQDADPIIELPRDGRAARSADLWQAPVDEWDDVGSDGWQQPVSEPAWAQTTSGWDTAYSAPKPQPWSGPGARRRALCVGIDDYPTSPLGGCVNDANDWGTALVNLGFEHRMLLNGAATRAAIMRELKALVDGSRAGDVIVFQYAGHGTSVPDLNGDEADGDTPGTDEAVCPVDCDSGELLIDDDIGAIFSRLPDGVNLTCFFDCCYSGTISRMAYGQGTATRPAGARARFIQPSRKLIEAFTAKRQAGAGSRSVSRAAGVAMREVVFSACLSSEVALENQGHGDFTRYALQVLKQGTAGLSNADFAARVTQAFGRIPRQHAKLYSSESSQTLALLQPLGAPQPIYADAAAAHMA
ncbi:caspase family protein [Massilia sp. S19_KUP03_FR1]|uniref:caspase family protein n=1 Tax=Massilia sp. S19_KUP03_FR1 TaxID=3025503 RepID=UPI002FCD8E7C